MKSGIKLRKDKVRGRPSVSTTNRYSVMSRYYKDEYKLIKKAAERDSRSIASLVRKLVLDGLNIS